MPNNVHTAAFAADAVYAHPAAGEVVCHRIWLLATRWGIEGD